MDYKVIDKQSHIVKRAVLQDDKTLFSREEKESLAITIAVFSLLLIALVFVGFPQGASGLANLEGGGGGGGVTVNFGDSDVGSGSDFRNEELNVTGKKQQAASSAAQEEIIGSNLDDAPAVVRTIKPVTSTPSKEQPKPIAPKETPPRQIKNSALDNILGGNSKGGDGEGGGSGNQGSLSGDRNSGGYSGTGGSGGGSGGGTGSGTGTGLGPGSGSGSGGGSGAGRGTGVGDYTLAGRKALAIPEPKYTCNEEGRVVVQIAVDRSGKVISATPGARGTTNTAKCLQDQAKAAALKARFDAGDSDKQIGTIVYNYRLTE